MRVAELIDVLRRYPQALEVELAVVAPPDGDEIEIDRFPVEGVLEWQDEDGASWLWLVGGDQEDVEAFLDDLEEDSRR